MFLPEYEDFMIQKTANQLIILNLQKIPHK